MTSLVYAFRFLLFGVLVIVSLCLLSLILAPALDYSNGTAGATNSVFSPGMAASPNVVSRSMATVLDRLDHGTSSMQNAIYGAPRSVDTAIANSGKLTANAGRSIVDGVHNSAVSVGRGIGSAVGYVLGIPGSIVKSITNFSVSSVIRPTASAPVPTIEQGSASFAPAPAAKKVAVVSQPGPPMPPPAISPPSWPIHGMVTTLFGVPEPPYEPIHTGIDISDGRSAGTTPVRPFRAGRVVEAEHSGGLGNHVVVDHGDGLTSVYGHFASISVHTGEDVNQSTVLGYEGSTGVSTGTHLHFEVRQNNQPVNPMLYIPGRP